MKKILVIARSALEHYSDAIRTESSKAIAFAGEGAFNYIHESLTGSRKPHAAGELKWFPHALDAADTVYLQVSNTFVYMLRQEMELAYYLSTKLGKSVTVYTVNDGHVEPVITPWAKGLGVTLRVIPNTQHNLYSGEIFDELVKE